MSRELNNNIIQKEETINVGNNHYSNHPLYYSQEDSLKDQPSYDCFRLLLVEQGTGIMLVDNCSIKIVAPCMICINETDFPVFKDCVDIKFESIYFKPRLLNSVFDYENIRSLDNTFSQMEQQDLYLLLPFLHRDTLFKGQFSIDENTLVRVSKLIQFIGRELEHTDIYWPCRSRSYLLEILILSTKLYDSNRNLSEYEMDFIPHNIEDVITYLHNNYREKITLEQLAILFNSNRTTLNNQFYKATKLSVIEYLIRLRIRVAATLLRDTLIPIAEVMSRVGFHDTSHFWRTFKKYMSLTPKEYREKYCWIKDLDDNYLPNPTRVAKTFPFML
jgi:AraC family L-rhamnose operon regulatory protein RhaS